MAINEIRSGRVIAHLFASKMPHLLLNRLMTVCLTAAALNLLSVVSHTDAEVPQADFEIAVGGGAQNGSKVTVQRTDDSAVFTIKCNRGIGKATIKLTGGSWPNRIVFRIHLKGLEQFTVTNGSETLSASVLSHGKNRQLLSFTGKGTREKSVRADSPYWTEVSMVNGNGKPGGKIPLKGGHFEVELPRELLKSGPLQLHLSWVDFYR